MVTMKDVALEAGVSVATVSYYINNKKRIAEDKAKRISLAIKKLNYIVQNSGRDLRARNNKDVGILFPDIAEPYLEKIISSIKGFLTQNQKNFLFELSDGMPEAETKALMDFLGKKVSGIILYSCQPNNLELFKSVSRSGIPFVLIDRKPEGFECNFVGCDNYNLFKRLANRLISSGKKDIALVGGPLDYNENKAAQSGYIEAIESNNLAVGDESMIFTSCLRESGFRAGIQLLEKNPKVPDVVLTTSLRLAEGLRYAFSINHIHPGIDVQIITSGDSADDVFYCDPTIIKNSRSAFDIGESAVRLLLSNMKSPVVFEHQQIIIEDVVDDIQPFSVPAVPVALKPASPVREINVLLLDDYYSVNGLQHLLIDFYKKENIKANIRKVLPEHSFEHICKALSDPGCDIDVVLFDVPWLRYLVERKFLLCIDDYCSSHNVTQALFIPTLFDAFGKVGGHYYAMPYMSCTQLLFYRKDFFTDENLMNDFEKRFLISLKTPSNWLQFNTIARYFTKRFNPDSPVEYGHAMSLPYTEQIMCDFFPRLWAYGGNLFNSNGIPCINTQQAKTALKNMLESVSYAHPSVLSDRPMDNVDKFIHGETAMLYTFFNYATPIVDRLKSSVASKFGFARLPGQSPILAGWSLGITRNSRYPEESFRFMKWACGADIAIPHTILGGQSPNLKVYRNYDMISLYPWLPKALSEFPKCRKRELPITCNLTRYSEKEIEDVVAAEICKLIEKTIKYGMPETQEIEQALENVQIYLKGVSAC